MIATINGEGVGAGKSYYVTTRLIDHFCAGHTAYLYQFELQWENFKKYCLETRGVILEDSQLHYISHEQVLRLHEHTPQGTPDSHVLIVLDEVQDAFDIYGRGDKARIDFFKWACQSRHDDNDILLISQDITNVDKALRKIATNEIFMRDMGGFKIPGIGNYATLVRFISLGLINGDYFRASIYDRSGKVLQDQKRIEKDKRIYDIYVSKTCRGKAKRAGQAVSRLQLKKVTPKTTLTMKIIIIICIVAAIFAGWNIYHRYNAMTKPAPVQQLATKENPVKQVPKLTPPQTRPVESEYHKPQKEKGAYDIYPEQYRGSIGGTLHTTEAEYTEGEMSLHGYVKAIRGRIALVVQPDGRHGYILAQDIVKQQPVNDKRDQQPAKQEKQEEHKPTQYADVLDVAQLRQQGLSQPDQYEDYMQRNMRLATTAENKPESEKTGNTLFRKNVNLRVQ